VESNRSGLGCLSACLRCFGRRAFPKDGHRHQGCQRKSRDAPQRNESRLHQGRMVAMKEVEPASQRFAVASIYLPGACSKSPGMPFGRKAFSPGRSCSTEACPHD